MNMTYETIVYNGISQYTVYSGASCKGAEKALDTTRAILLLGRGKGDIVIRESSGKVFEKWTVSDGYGR
jgi:hypothetical protein